MQLHNKAADILSFLPKSYFSLDVFFFDAYNQVGFNLLHRVVQEERI